MSAEANAQDPYTYKGTSVLLNKRDYRDPAAVAMFENDRVARRSAQIPEDLRAAPLDGAHFRAIHLHLFQDVYDWAGAYRTVNLSKGQSTFTRADALDSQGKRIFGGLEADNHLRGLEKPAFVEKLTDCYTAVNTWHPFREGNGRTTRVFFDQLARNAGYRLDLRRIGREEWNHAAERGHQGDREPMQAIFTKSVRPLRAVAFEVMERFSAIQRFPELQAAYDLQDAMVRKAATQYPNNRQARDHFAKQAKDHVLLQLDAGRVPNAQVLNQGLAASAKPAVAAPAMKIEPRSRGR